MTKVWFKPLNLVTSADIWRAMAKRKPIESSEHFLAPCTWQGWLITAIATGLGYGAARLAMYLYTVKAEYGLAGWAGFVVIILITMHIANTFSNRP